MLEKDNEIRVIPEATCLKVHQACSPICESHTQLVMPPYPWCSSFLQKLGLDWLWTSHIPRQVVGCLTNSLRLRLLCELKRWRLAWYAVQAQTPPSGMVSAVGRWEHELSIHHLLHRLGQRPARTHRVGSILLSRILRLNEPEKSHSEQLFFKILNEISFWRFMQKRLFQNRSRPKKNRCFFSE